jgi:hypothetical protein
MTGEERVFNWGASYPGRRSLAHLPWADIKRPDGASVWFGGNQPNTRNRDLAGSVLGAGIVGPTRSRPGQGPRVVIVTQS